MIAAERMGWKNRFHCEINEYCNSKVKKRYPNSIQYEDIRNFDAREWKGGIDIISGGFPCQDISSANRNAVGITGQRSGLWGEYARVIHEVRPKFVVIENSPNLLRKGLEKILFDLSEIGYDAEWECISAEAFGYPHERVRLFIVAYPAGFRQPGQGNLFENCRYNQESRDWQTNNVINAIQRKTLPPLCDSNNGFPERVVKDGKITLGNAALHALGNALIPEIAYQIFKSIQSTI